MHPCSINEIIKFIFELKEILRFEKAFESVKLNILIDKLEYYGSRRKALELFQSYLKTSIKVVKMYNVFSVIL